jgi:hypothetical protein
VALFSTTRNRDQVDGPGSVVKGDCNGLDTVVAATVEVGIPRPAATRSGYVLTGVTRGCMDMAPVRDLRSDVAAGAVCPVVTPSRGTVRASVCAIPRP